MPEFAGLSHVSLSVRNRDVSRDWYHRVLGFEQLEESKTDAYDEWILLHPRNHLVLCLHSTRRTGARNSIRFAQVVTI
jgi:glyoxylase I family protein